MLTSLHMIPIVCHPCPYVRVSVVSVCPCLRVSACPCVRVPVVSVCQAILHDKIHIADAVNVEVISLDDAPKGYAEFDQVCLFNISVYIQSNFSLYFSLYLV